MQKGEGGEEAVKLVKQLESYLHMNECIVWLACFRLPPRP